MIYRFSVNFNIYDVHNHLYVVAINYAFEKLADVLRFDKMNIFQK